MWRHDAAQIAIPSLCSLFKTAKHQNGLAMRDK
jgi:hypothetical protein